METYGNLNQAQQMMSQVTAKKKRLSGDWIPKVEPQLLKQPLGEMYMNITKVIHEFRCLVRYFVGKGKSAKY